MPLELDDDEVKAMKDAWTHSECVDWNAYDRAILKIKNYEERHIRRLEHGEERTET